MCEISFVVSKFKAALWDTSLSSADAATARLLPHCRLLSVFHDHASGFSPKQERPGTEVWVDLDQKQIPLLLNYAQCKLNLGDYAACITHCTEVLEKIDGAVSKDRILELWLCQWLRSRQVLQVATTPPRAGSPLSF